MTISVSKLKDVPGFIKRIFMNHQDFPWGYEGEGRGKILTHGMVSYCCGFQVRIRVTGTMGTLVCMKCWNECQLALQITPKGLVK